MKGKVAVATVQGKAYFQIVNALKEQRHQLCKCDSRGICASKS